MCSLFAKYNFVRNINKISSIYLPSRNIQMPTRYDLLKEAAADRLLLNWFDKAWGKTKNSVLDNWESAGLIKRRKPTNENRKSSPSITNSSTIDDELAKAKNKAQRHLAENWDAIKRANSTTNQKIVDDVRESATTTVDELSKSFKEKADTLIDETTTDIKSKIIEKGDDLKQKISK